MKNSTLLIYGVLTGVVLFLLALFGLDALFIAAEAEDLYARQHPFIAD